VKNIFVFVIVVLAAASSAAAQALPFTKGMVTKESYAKALELNDRKVLNVDCRQILTAFNQAFSERLQYHFEDCKSLAGYFRRLDEKPLPQQKMHFGRILPNGNVDLEGFSREALLGEMGLFDNQSGIYPVSLMCGNLTPDKLPAPTYTTLTTEEEKPAAQPSSPPPTPVPAPSIAAAAAQQAAAASASPTIFKPQPSSRSRSWYDPRGKKGVLFWGAVGTGIVVAACNVPEPRCFTSMMTVTQTVIMQ